MDEIRQRMEQEQELFQFKREMAEVELARAKVQLQISEQQFSTMKKRTVIAMQDDGSVVETIMIQLAQGVKVGPLNEHFKTALTDETTSKVQSCLQHKQMVVEEQTARGDITGRQTGVPTKVKARKLRYPLKMSGTCST